MTKLEKITNRINDNKELSKSINNVKFYRVEQFIDDGVRYMKAIKEGRIINSIGSVSKSGMSRSIKFLECNKSKSGFHYLNFNAFFDVLGYSKSRTGSGYFTVNGCGMDMIFHTNYTNIHNLKNLGFINKKQCATLAQMTPTTI